MKTVQVTEVTVTKVQVRGSNAVRWNYDRNGVPFGQVWTFIAKGEIHPYHVKPLNGDHKTVSTFTEADVYMRGLM